LNPESGIVYLDAVKRFEFVEHTADIAIKAYGNDLAEAYAASADAMFEIITDGAPITHSDEFRVRVQSDTRESLLVRFLSELIVIHEVNRVVLSDFEVKLSGEFSLEATARGEPFDSERHAQGQHVKGVSYHMLEIHDGGPASESFVRVLFDV